MQRTLLLARTLVLAGLASPLLAQSFTQPAQPSARPATSSLAPTFPVNAGWVALGSFDVPAYSAIAPLSNGRTLVFDGEHVDVYDALGGIAQRVCSTGAFRFPSFVVADEARGVAWVSESSQDALWQIDLAQGTFAQIATIHFAFAAARESAGTLLVTASPCGFYCGADVIRLDLATHALATLGHVSGASGPIAFDSGGGLLYGVEANALPQPGELWVARWSAAQLAQAPAQQLTLAAATKAASVLDGDSSLAYDARSNGLVVAETNSLGGTAIVAFDAHGERVGVVAETSVYASNLACVEVSTNGPAGALQAFQPRGMRLTWLETDWAVFPPLTTVRSAEPVRPRLDVVTFANGSVELVVTGAPARSTVLVGVVPATSAITPERVVVNDPALVFSAIPALGANAPSAVCDASGTARIRVRSLPHTQSVLQAFFVDARGRAIASSAPVAH